MGLVIFIESGVLFPFLPGDSLLVTAAILRDDLGLSVPLILLVGTVAAFLGDQVGFWLGHTFGRRLFKPDAKILKTEYLERAEAFFRKHGPLALVLGRFVPIVRTYVPVSAGTAAMPYKKFVGWNVLGAVAWIVTMTMVGVLLGGIPGIADRIDAIVVVIVGVSVLPVVISGARSWRHKPDAPANDAEPAR
ncbi:MULTISPECIES: DedA family protein [unclassified Corynebacterium]|uniref:DedA family protein n=1 Tax=unclassified Corynebacterium TaxID=2624378 RepID=UPI0034CEEAE0